MSLPILIKTLFEKKLDAYCKKRIPPHAAGQVRLIYKLRGNSVTLIEQRAPWMKSDTEWTAMPIVQFRFDQKKGVWSLYYPDRNNKWHLYVDFEPTKDIETALVEIDDDPTHIFWG